MQPEFRHGLLGVCRIGTCDCDEVVELLKPVFEAITFADRGDRLEITATLSTADPWQAMACIP